MLDSPRSNHILGPTGSDLAFVSQGVFMTHGALNYIAERGLPSVRVPGKPRQLADLGPQLYFVQHQKGIQFFCEIMTQVATHGNVSSLNDALRTQDSLEDSKSGHTQKIPFFNFQQNRFPMDSASLGTTLSGNSFTIIA
jgi:hypothetical protein